MPTELTNKWTITKKQFDEILTDRMRSYIDDYIGYFPMLMEEVRDLGSTQPIYIKKRKCYLDIKLSLVIPDLADWKLSKISSLKKNEYKKHLKRVLDDHVAELPTLKELRRIAPILKNYYDVDACFVCKNDDIRYIERGKIVAYKPVGSRIISSGDALGKPLYVLPVNRIVLEKNKMELDLVRNYFIPYGMCPEGLSEKAKELLADLTLLHKKRYFDFNENGEFIWEKDKLLGDFMKKPKDYTELHWQLTELLKEYYKSKCITGVEMNQTDKLLQCEKIRADIDPYEERILTDPNRGHWDLWREDKENKDYTIETENQLVARNPISDINENGVIAIDFGTKSTIVVYQSGIEHSLPMGIGDGNLSKEPTMKRYENPTVMHFVNPDRFKKDYESKKGRPDTKWEDLTISHTAMDQFEMSNSDAYYEFMHQIKQWAGQRGKQFRLKPHEGDTILLPSFLDLPEDSINPIEIYAYYIGLYINNMRKGHGIFLDYYLSFPVTYEMRIREKIIKSFEKGLKKSLPESILNNKEIMKQFHVNGEISEPAAYAVCALQEYGFEPKEGEEIFYGIFDFGGGTTDFDFGIWKQSEKRRYDYAIENFGAGGDEFLGGENLLEMLAFDVFKKNQDYMREHRYTFTLAPKCKEFAGSDALLSDSQEAEKNMHNLMEKLRPYWEKTDTDKEEDEFQAYIKRLQEQNKKYATFDKLQEILSWVQKVYLSGEIDFAEAKQKIWDQVREKNLDDIKDLEDIESSESKTILKVELFARSGEMSTAELKFNLDEIEQFIEEKIREGVKNFFSALLLSYQNERVRKSPTVNILLAGNSCKSPVVRKVFEEEIEIQQEEIKNRYDDVESVENLFEIFPPLGTEEAFKKMEQRGVSYNRDDFERPTGKTGVAFGLLQCRQGGTIERIVHSKGAEEIPFQYFIGWRSRGKFVVFKDDVKPTKYLGKPDYNIWYKFIEADLQVFELYYTTLPECVNGNLVVDGNAEVSRYRCNIDQTDEDAFVYIRAVDPHTIEYVVAKDEKNVDGTKLGEIFKKELG